MAPPSWFQDAVFYQIFPDRFANGDPSNDPPDVQPWGAPPTVHGFQGGDLRGVRDRLDYLADLGINSIYLNPIFQAASNHRYDTSDYLAIDDRLGTLADFRGLVDQAHRRGIRIVLDGVFNHSGRGFHAFRDLLSRGPSSPFTAWYHIHGFPLDAFGEDGRAANYEAWWGMRNLPKFNISHPDVRGYLLKAARTWTEHGIDGWRLDVPNEIPDRSFWETLRQTVVKINPEAVLLGEIWTVGPDWVGPTAFDGLMNYPLRTALLDLVADRKITAGVFRDQVSGIFEAYPEAHRTTHYNLLGSHDTDRLTTRLGGDERKARLLFALLFGLPGAPGIYYGDEIGMEGGKDPDCRRAFPWDRSAWETGRRDLITRLIRLRGARLELRRGQLRFMETGAPAALAIARVMAGAASLLVANIGESPLRGGLDVAGLGWDGDRGVTDGMTGRRLEVVGGRIAFDLDPFGFFFAHDG